MPGNTMQLVITISRRKHRAISCSIQMRHLFIVVIIVLLISHLITIMIIIFKYTVISPKNPYHYNLISSSSLLTSLLPSSPSSLSHSAIHLKSLRHLFSDCVLFVQEKKKKKRKGNSTRSIKEHLLRINTIKI